MKAPTLAMVIEQIDTVAAEVRGVKEIVNAHEIRDKAEHDRIYKLVNDNATRFGEEHQETRRMISRDMEVINAQFETVAHQIAGVNHALEIATQERRIAIEAAAELKESAERLRVSSSEMKETGEMNNSKFEAIRASLAAMHDVMQRFR